MLNRQNHIRFYRRKHEDISAQGRSWEENKNHRKTLRGSEWEGSKWMLCHRGLLYQRLVWLLCQGGVWLLCQGGVWLLCQGEIWLLCREGCSCWVRGSVWGCCDIECM